MLRKWIMYRAFRKALLEKRNTLSESQYAILDRMKFLQFCQAIPDLEKRKGYESSYRSGKFIDWLKENWVDVVRILISILVLLHEEK